MPDQTNEAGVHRAQHHDISDGGSIVVGKINGKEDCVYIHIHGNKYGDVTKIKLTTSEAGGLSRLLTDVAKYDGTTVMGLKSAPMTGFRQRIEPL